MEKQKEKQKDTRALLIKILAIALIIVDIIVLNLPLFTFTKTTSIYNFTETLTIKASFFKVVLNSDCNIVSSFGETVIKTIKFEEIWLTPEQFQSVRLIIGFVGANFIVSIALLGFSVVSNYTNHHHTWYVMTSCLLFFAVSLHTCMLLNPNASELLFALDFPVSTFVLVVLVHLVVEIIIDKLEDKLKENAFNTLFNKYKNESEKFKEDFIANVAECIGESRYESSIDVLNIISGAVDILDSDKKEDKN